MNMLETAIEAVETAGVVVQRSFEDADFEREEKDDKTWVTRVDRESEEIITTLIRARHPDHGIVGEEGSLVNPDAEYQWVVDPLDGTMNFVHGIPLFSISIAVMQNALPVAAVVYNPITRSLYAAEAGRGMSFNGRPGHVSKEDALSGLFAEGHSTKKRDSARKLFASAGGIFRAGRVFSSCALEMAYVANGSLEAYISIGLKKWDYAAGWLLVKEAGGTITDYDGNPCDLTQSYFVATNGVAHDAALALVQSIRE